MGVWRHTGHTPAAVHGVRLLHSGGVAESYWFVAIEGHDLQRKWRIVIYLGAPYCERDYLMAVAYLFNTIPVGLGQVEATSSGSRLVPNHADLCDGREALSSGRHAVLSRVKYSPVVPSWCCRGKPDLLNPALCAVPTHPIQQTTKPSQYL